MNKHWNVAKKAIGVAGIFTAKLLIDMAISSSKYETAKKNALVRAENKWADSGYHDAYMPTNITPTEKDFD